MFTVGMGGTDHWNSKLSTNVQCEKNNYSSQKICTKINKITTFLTHFESLKTSYI